MQESPPTTPRARQARAALVTVALVSLTVWPVLRRPPVDSFPHSTYPMFSENRSPVADIDLVVGFDDGDRKVTLSPELIAGTEEVIVAGSVVRQAVRGGPTQTERLCDAVADRVASMGPAEVVRLSVRTERYDAVAWFAGDREPMGITDHTTCDVDR